jgi:hypothetical protein
VPLEFVGDFGVPGETLDALTRRNHLEERQLVAGTFAFVLFVLAFLLEVGKFDVKIFVALVADDDFKVYSSRSGRVGEELARRVRRGGIARRNPGIGIVFRRFERHRKTKGTFPFKGGKKGMAAGGARAARMLSDLKVTIFTFLNYRGQTARLNHSSPRFHMSW